MDGKTWGSLYKTLLVRYPLAANGLQGGALSGLAQATKQVLHNKVVNDPTAVLHFAIISAFVINPVMQQWIRFLYRRPIPLPKLRALVLELTFGGFVLNALFLCALFALRGRVDLIPSEVLSVKFVIRVGLGSQKVWVPAKALMVWFVPPWLHPICTQLTSFFWQIVLAFLASPRAS